MTLVNIPAQGKGFHWQCLFKAPRPHFLKFCCHFEVQSDYVAQAGSELWLLPTTGIRVAHNHSWLWSFLLAEPKEGQNS